VANKTPNAMLGQSPFFGQRLAELGNKKGRFSVLDRSKNQYQINQLTGCLQSKRVVTVLGISLHFGHDSMTPFHSRNADLRICRQVRRIAMLERRCLHQPIVTTTSCQIARWRSAWPAVLQPLSFVPSTVERHEGAWPQE